MLIGGWLLIHILEHLVEVDVEFHFVLLDKKGRLGASLQEGAWDLTDLVALDQRHQLLILIEGNGTLVRRSIWLDFEESVVN